MTTGKILIVDDEKIILTAYGHILRKEGHMVFTAISSREAIDIARKERLDIIFTDLVMPDFNGVEICKIIKEIQPKVEIVLISGYLEEAVKYQIDFIKAGGREEWLRKPLLENELTEVAEKILKERGKEN